MLTRTETPAQLSLASDPVRYEQWAPRACNAALRSFDSNRMAAATTVLGASRRVRLVGSGVGFDVARFGVEALSESGLDAAAGQAHDLASFPARYSPDETVIGIDTDASEVGAALRRASAAGLRTIVLTDRELTRVGADVLLPHPALSHEGPAATSPLAASFVLALLAARLEPASGLAREVAAFPEAVSHLRSSLAVAAQVAAGLQAPGRRLLLAGAGSTRWVAASIARRINGNTTHAHLTPALDLHAADLRAAEWSGRTDDVIVAIEPLGNGEDTPADRASERQYPAAVWRIGGAPAGADYHTRLPLTSPALASLCALFLLELLLVELATD